jgi:hypothetical protein
MVYHSVLFLGNCKLFWGWHVPSALIKPMSYHITMIHYITVMYAPTVKHLDQIITSLIAKRPCTHLLTNHSTSTDTQQVISIQKQASREGINVTHPFCILATCHSWSLSSHHWGRWTATFRIHPEWKTEWHKYKCDVL